MKPLADKECNTTTKEKSLGTAAGEDDVKEDEPIIRPRLFGEGTNMIHEDNKLMQHKFAWHDVNKHCTVM